MEIHLYFTVIITTVHLVCGIAITKPLCRDLLSGKWGTPNPVDVNECQELQAKKPCKFDVSQCDECLMGYAVNEDGCSHSCDCATHGIVEGDIKFEEEDVTVFFQVYESPQQDFNEQEAADNHVKLWNYKTASGDVDIPYVINVTSEKGVNAIEEAIRRFSDKTCIKLRPWTDEENYISFIADEGCWSYVGMRGGNQNISIGMNCEYPGLVQHEILHALGFWHEQSRPDRNQYISINYDNIREDKIHNFNTRTTIDSLGFLYDRMSLMHYGGYAFTKNGLPTIIDMRTNQPIRSQRDHLTDSDLSQLNQLYSCNTETSEEFETYWSQWASWSGCDVTCGHGIRRRKRKCIRKRISRARMEKIVLDKCAQGQKLEYEQCIMAECLTVGYWTEWGEWQQCTQTCGSGYQIRGRSCENGFPGEKDCFGQAWEGKTCNAHTCTTNNLIFASTIVKTLNLFCQHGESFIGDFNGDGIADVACSYYIGWLQIANGGSDGTYGTITWEGPTDFKSNTCEAHVGDFNCDGSDDILCYHKDKKLFNIHLSSDGKFSKEVDFKENSHDFCGEIGDVLSVADINGDMCHDIICRSISGAITTIKNIMET